MICTTIIGIKALSRTVLAVATKGSCNDWTAYIDSVPGDNILKEADKVAEEGNRLSEDIARLLFKGEPFIDLHYRR